MAFSRRTVLTAGATGAAFAGLAQFASAATTPAEVQADAYRNEVAGYGPLKPDPFGLFDLPGGFSYTAISRAGDPMSDGLVTPYKADGMGCFPLDRDRVSLVRNHELSFLRDIDYGPFGVSHALADKSDASRVYDRLQDGRALTGGTTTLVYNLRTRRLENSHLSLVGTSTNCAGGVTPWGSWLSCEEIVATPGAKASHGWVFEVPSRQKGLVEPVALTGMGRFKHEATCTDPGSGVTYLTEDEVDGLFYRYLPNDRRNLAKGGRLQALGFKDGGKDTRNWEEAPTWKAGAWRDTVWIDLDDVESPDADLRKRGHAKGAALVCRGEGIHFGKGEMYLTATNGGPARLGQILRYVPSRFEGDAGEAGEPGRLQLFHEAADKTVMEMADNLTIAPWGHLIVCEDKFKAGGVNYLRGVTPEGKVYALGRQAQPARSSSSANAELAGACFSPDGTTLFVNVYWPGVTLAITGPWSRFRT